MAAKPPAGIAREAEKLTPGIPPRRVVLTGVVDEQHRYVAAEAGDSSYRPGEVIVPGTVLTRPTPAWHLAQLFDEPTIAFTHREVWGDGELMVVDKPPFLPTTSNGRLMKQTLQTRLRIAHGTDITPLHRLDRLTSGLVMCSTNPATRGAYQRLFQDHAVTKTYLARVVEPESVSTHWQEITVSMQKVAGQRAVSVGRGGSLTTTRLRRRPGTEVIELQPRTGHTHQLRALMNYLGHPIIGDDTYPVDLGLDLTDFSRVLQLRAVAISFDDPLDGRHRDFRVSQRWR